MFQASLDKKKGRDFSRPFFL